MRDETYRQDIKARDDEIERLRKKHADVYARWSTAEADVERLQAEALRENGKRLTAEAEVERLRAVARAVRDRKWGLADQLARAALGEEART